MIGSAATQPTLRAARTSRGAGSIYFEIVVTVGTFVVPALLAAAFAFFHPGDGMREERAQWMFGQMVVRETLCLALVFHVMGLHRERLGDFTHSPRWSDIPWTCLLLAASVAAVYGTYFGLWYLNPATIDGMRRPANTEFLRVGMSSFYIAMLAINPLCEEFLMRGFLQTRLRQAGWPALATVFASATLQGAYHIYQGLPSALAIGCGFLVLAAFYQKTNRLWPVVGAHLLIDVGVVVLIHR